MELGLLIAIILICLGILLIPGIVVGIVLLKIFKNKKNNENNNIIEEE